LRGCFLCYISAAAAATVTVTAAEAAVAVPVEDEKHEDNDPDVGIVKNVAKASHSIFVLSVFGGLSAHLILFYARKDYRLRSSRREDVETADFLPWTWIFALRRG
jgi:hypothetical protein